MNDDPIVFDGALEIRARDRGGRVLSGRFPLNKTATVRSGGRVRKERFAPDSMSWQVREFQKLQAELADVANQKIAQVQKEILIEQLEDAIEKRNTFLLVGHSYDRAIADMRSGTLAVGFIRPMLSNLRRRYRTMIKCRPGCAMRSWPSRVSSYAGSRRAFKLPKDVNI